MIETILILFFLLLLLHYFLFIFEINSGIKKINGVTRLNAPNDFISIIIPFRNESENILNSLKCIEQLDHDVNNFEVIYVDDSSDDDGCEKLEINIKAPNIKVIAAPADPFGKGHKKRAVIAGINFAKGSIIVTTDADCIFGRNWLNSLLGTFDSDTAFVSGPVKFTDENSMFERIQLIEFAGLVLAGAGLIGSNRPVICNAANLAYRKDVFFRVNGYQDNLHLSSGDDEFLMQKISSETNYKVKFCFNNDSVVETKPNKTLASFVQQRTRWASKSVFYKDKILILQLVLIYLFYAGLTLLPVFATFLSAKYILIFLSALFIKIFVEQLVVSKGRKLFNLKYNIIEFILAELFQVTYIILLSIAGLRGNFVWKDRKLKR